MGARSGRLPSDKTAVLLRQLASAWFVCFCLVALLWSEYTPGNANFSYYSQMPLEKTTSGGGISQSYAAAVGGVAFVTTAQASTNLRSIALDYDPSLPDGRRFVVSLNGERLTANIFDWELIPTAKFADSPYDASFTMFGSLQDKDTERRVLSTNGRILNYHAAFLNTLAGLRLFQMDLMLESHALPELIRDNNGKFILGGGETDPDNKAEKQAATLLFQKLDTISRTLDMRFRSYILSDYDEKIEFGSRQGALWITGEPAYHFWRYKSDTAGFNKAAQTREMTHALEQQLASAKAHSPGGFDPRAWLIAHLLPAIEQYSMSYTFYSSGTVAELAGIRPAARDAMLRRYSTDSLQQLLLDLRIELDSHQIEMMPSYSERLSREQDLLRSLNPAVWNSGTTIMRYAAFFRFVKRQNRSAWDQFIAHIGKASETPEVRTPTAIN